MHNNIKLFVSLSVLSSLLYAGDDMLQDDYLQIVAKNLEVKDSIIKANGNVILYSPTYYITANNIIYDKNSTNLELFGDVNILNNQNLSLYTQYAYLNIKEKSNKFNSMFVTENKENIWFKTLDSNFTNNVYSLKDGALSSCDCENPDWYIGFSKGDYNVTKQWINTYDTTLYINDLPILYTPYFGFPTSKDRQTGFLRPAIGWLKDEGMLYAQPFYYAPKINYDIEIIPQVKTKRGYGGGLKYRYADSLYSIFNFETAYFRETDDYFKNKALENQEHYGWKLEYKRDKLFSNNDNSDGLLLQSIDMNDVDYINTQYDNDNMNYTNKLLESKIKYYFNTNNFYSDIGVRLYNNISQNNSDDVAQNLPSISYYKYSRNLFFNHLSYSSNIDFTRNTKKVGLSTDITNITLPLQYNYDFFDDYLNFNFIEKIYFKNINYNINVDDLNYVTYDHILNLSTDILKQYNDYIHTFKIDFEMLESNEYLKVGYESDEIPELTSKDDTIIISLNQSLYNNDSLNELINHTINQSYYYDNNQNKYIKQDLENYIRMKYNYASISNRLKYNYDKKTIVSSSSALKYNDTKIFTNISHSFIKNDLDNSNSESVSYDLGFNFNKFYTISYKEEFDLIDNISKKKEYLFKIKKKCWDFDIKMTDSIVATNRIDNSVIRQKILYLQFNLKQLFKMKQYYKFNEDVE